MTDVTARGIEWLLAAAKCALFAAALAVAALLCSCDGPREAHAGTQAGQPLDATEHEAPAFAGGGRAYLVVDRASGQRWWLVQMRGQWVVLPLWEVDG